MVGKNPNGGCGQTHIDTINRIKRFGKIRQTTIRLASQLETPHHEGAGGFEDFEDKESFQKHVKRVSKRNKRKR